MELKRLGLAHEQGPRTKDWTGERTLFYLLPSSSLAMVANCMLDVPS